MLHCTTCDKEVVVYALSRGAPGADEIAREVRSAATAAGRLVLFNPPPWGPQRCPGCNQTALVERADPREGA